MSAFLALLHRDVRLAWRIGGVGVALGFFATVTVLLPLGVGPDQSLLTRIGGGVLWLAAMLAALLSLETLFQADFEDGSLDLIVLSPLPLELAVSAKIAAHWLVTGLPLALVACPAAAMFALPPQAAGMLAATLLIGTAAISALGACGAALTLSLRRGALLLPLIVLPLLSPAVIFGAAAVLAALDEVPSGAFLLLAAFSLAVLALSPFAAAAAIRVHLAE
jgi:heme exporter protein B